MKIRPMGGELFRVDGRADGQTEGPRQRDRQTDMLLDKYCTTTTT